MGRQAVSAAVGHHSPLWDDTFRARMLRHGLANDEILQAVEAAEEAARAADRYRAALETIVRTSKLGGAVEIAREALQ